MKANKASAFSINGHSSALGKGLLLADSCPRRQSDQSGEGDYSLAYSDTERL
jgi:hypothetical protein